MVYALSMESIYIVVKPHYEHFLLHIFVDNTKGRVHANLNLANTTKKRVFCIYRWISNAMFDSSVAMSFRAFFLRDYGLRQ